jgi:hypothetical protein
MKKDIIQAIVFLREKNNTIPSEVLDFMRDASLQREKAIEIANQSKLSEEQINKCVDALRLQGVNTEAMSWGTLKEIAKAMIETVAKGGI